MTLSDPLIKELKAQISALVLSDSNNGSTTGPFYDNDEKIIGLCTSLEKIFAKGLVRHDGFSPWKTDSFQWFYQLVRKYQKTIPLVFKVAFDEVLGNMKTKTGVGKTRLLIRTCLKRRCLFVPLQFHIENQDYNDTSLRITYDQHNSILGHEILSQIFLSLLQQLSCYSFAFDLTNSAFLDEAWQLPTLVKTEIVPCEQLGITLGFPLGFPIVVEILENSSADEIRDLIAIGDIVEEMNGVFVRHYFGSKLDNHFRKIRSAPFSLSILKGVNPRTQQVYLPIIKLWRILGLDPEAIAGNRAMSPLPIITSSNEEPLLTSPNPPEALHDLMSLSSRSLSQSPIEKDGTAANTTPAIFTLKEELNGVFENFVSSDPPYSTNIDSGTPEEDEEEKVPLSASLLSTTKEKEKISSPKPYPESQQNNSSESALNLQKYTMDSEQLIV